ncbi:Homeodomain-interacting protein kinase 3 [Merluccius polli]|uniref:Homeodomain-interacting protein kinase 3 n=1 Tax=Merluccius polli TaxID=89951 RepID=A0AA47M602_MERPO|nr:Homeodomain-interacting protein kinase 3 [Merluccius polli]
MNHLPSVDIVCHRTRREKKEILEFGPTQSVERTQKEMQAPAAEKVPGRWKMMRGRRISNLRERRCGAAEGSDSQEVFLPLAKLIYMHVVSSLESESLCTLSTPGKKTVRLNRMPHPEKDLWVEEQEVLTSTSSRYLVQSFRGEGSFGKVTTCLNMDTKQTVAVKILKQMDYNMVGTEEEIAMLQRLKALDPDKCNIVRWFEHFVHRGHTCMVFEMLDISLFDFMSARHQQPLSLLEISVITQQLAVAFQALKANGLIHADLKGDNIMFVNQREQPLKVKLIDFGLAVPVSEVALGKTFQALPYRAPEVVLGLPITEAIDIWSLGCVIVSLFLRDHLYPCRSEYELLRVIMRTHEPPSEHLLNNGIKSHWYFTTTDEDSPHHGWRLKEFYTKPAMEEDTPPRAPLDNLIDLLPLVYPEEDEDILLELIDLLKGMLTIDPDLRMTPGDILQHPYVSLLPAYYGHSL